MPQSVYLKQHFKSLCLSVSSFFLFCLIVSLLSMRGFPAGPMMIFLLFLEYWVLCCSYQPDSVFLLLGQSHCFCCLHIETKEICVTTYKVMWSVSLVCYTFAFILKLNLLKKLEHIVNYSDMYML